MTADDTLQTRPDPDAACKLSRVRWLDVARGIGIILVVYGHVLNGLERARLIGPGGALPASNRAVYSFHMPLFFFLAGLSVERSYGKDSAGFLRNKFTSIGYPYLLWSFVQGAIQLAVPAFVNAPRPLYSLLSILWQPIAQFWFLYALLACHLIAWVCRLRRGPIAVLATGALLSFSLMPTSILQAIAKMFPFYASGVFVPILAARHPEKVKSLLLCLVSAFAYGFCLYDGGMSALSTPLIDFLAAVSGIAATIFLSQSLEALGTALAVPLAFLGRASMTIYVLHILATVSVRDILLQCGQTLVAEQLTLGVAAGIAIPLVVSAALEKFHASKLFGIPAAAQRRTAPPLRIAKPI